jgi:hypothetical protein
MRVDDRNDVKVDRLRVHRCRAQTLCEPGGDLGVHLIGRASETFARVGGEWRRKTEHCQRQVVERGLAGHGRHERGVAAELTRVDVGEHEQAFGGVVAHEPHRIVPHPIEQRHAKPSEREVSSANRRGDTRLPRPGAQNGDELIAEVDPAAQRLERDDDVRAKLRLTGEGDGAGEMALITF